MFIFARKDLPGRRRRALRLGAALAGSMMLVLAFAACAATQTPSHPSPSGFRLQTVAGKQQLYDRYGRAVFGAHDLLVRPHDEDWSGNGIRLETIPEGQLRFVQLNGALHLLASDGGGAGAAEGVYAADGRCLFRAPGLVQRKFSYRNDCLVVRHRGKETIHTLDRTVIFGRDHDGVRRLRLIGADYYLSGIDEGRLSITSESGEAVWGLHESILGFREANGESYLLARDAGQVRLFDREGRAHFGAHEQSLGLQLLGGRLLHHVRDGQGAARREALVDREGRPHHGQHETIWPFRAQDFQGQTLVPARDGEQQACFDQDGRPRFGRHTYILGFEQVRGAWVLAAQRKGRKGHGGLFNPAGLPLEIYGGLHDQLLGFVDGAGGRLLHVRDDGREALIDIDGRPVFGAHERFITRPLLLGSEELALVGDGAFERFVRGDGRLSPAFGGLHTRVRGFLSIDPDAGVGDLARAARRPQGLGALPDGVGERVALCQDGDRQALYTPEGRRVFGAHRVVRGLEVDARGELLLCAGGPDDQGHIRLGLFDRAGHCRFGPHRGSVGQVRLNGEALLIAIDERMGLYREDGSLVSDFGGLHDEIYGLEQVLVLARGGLEQALRVRDQGAMTLVTRDGTELFGRHDEILRLLFLFDEHHAEARRGGLLGLVRGDGQNVFGWHEALEGLVPLVDAGLRPRKLLLARDGGRQGLFERDGTNVFGAHAELIYQRVLVDGDEVLVIGKDDGREGYFDRAGCNRFGLHDQVLGATTADGLKLVIARDGGRAALFQADGRPLDAFGGPHEEILGCEQAAGETVLNVRRGGKWLRLRRDGSVLEEP